MRKRLITTAVVGVMVGAVLTIGLGTAAARGGHAPIVIASDADFAGCHCVVSGGGTMADPYVIGPWSINNVKGAAVSIDGTNLTKSFVLSNL
ncbi:MAG TPA: hypothetical protein VE757_04005, partial [Gaiellaceae bacterium]|nr:hypothetical protein [Gaiellaceae bacterium]